MHLLFFFYNFQNARYVLLGHLSFRDRCQVMCYFQQIFVSACSCLRSTVIDIPIFQYISNKMQLYTVYLYLETALHISGGTSTHYQERIQLYLQHLLFVTPLLLPAAIAGGSSNRVTNTRCCRYSCMRS